MTGAVFSLLILVVTGRLLYQQYNTQAVLLFSGFAMIIASQFINPTPLEVKQPSGLAFFDFFSLIKDIFSKTNAGVGLMIMTIGGFVAYMDHIGASDKLVSLAIQPITKWSLNPYLLASLALPLTQILFIAIPSAAGLGLLLMASLYRILVRLGLSRLSAVSIITASTAFGIGPACATTASTVEILHLDAAKYFIFHQIPLVWPLTLILMVTYFFTNKYFDQKLQKEDFHLEPSPQNHPENQIPNFYALLPLLPILLLIGFSSLFNVFPQSLKLDTSTAMILSLFIALFVETFRKKQLKESMASLQIFWNGMGDIFKSVITLIICAEIFAQGLIRLGFIDSLIQLTGVIGFSTTAIGILLTVMIFLASIFMGSGNAAFFSFGPLVPKIAAQIGMNATHLILPMQLAASMGRTVSPVSGIVLATAQLAKVSPLEMVKRNSIPFFMTLFFLIISHFLF